MQPQHPSQAEGGQAEDDQAAHGPQPAPAAARPRRRVLLLAAILVVVLLAGATALTYALGGFNDHGKFRAEPPACATLAPSVHLLGIEYTLQQDEANNCNLVLPANHRFYTPYPKITVAYAVSTPRRKDAPDAVSRLLREQLEKLRQDGQDVRALPGVGDEAYVRDRDVFLRVSNVAVWIMQFPPEASTGDQVRAFAADLAVRLRDS